MPINPIICNNNVQICSFSLTRGTPKKNSPTDLKIHKNMIKLSFSGIDELCVEVGGQEERSLPGLWWRSDLTSRSRRLLLREKADNPLLVNPLQWTQQEAPSSVSADSVNWGMNEGLRERRREKFLEAGPSQPGSGLTITYNMLSCYEPGKSMYVCMYLLIGKGQSAQKRPYWGEDRIKRKIYE